MVRAPNGDNKADPDANNGKGDGDHGSDGDHKVDLLLPLPLTPLQPPVLLQCVHILQHLQNAL